MNSDFPTENYEKAARYCASNEHCRKQIIDFLLKRKITTTDIEKICQKLEKEGFVNNLRFAKLYAISKLNQNSWGKIKIRFGLKQLQISENDISIAIQSIDDEVYEKALHRVLQKAMKAHPCKNEVNYQKVVKFAVSKGFEVAMILKNLPNSSLK